MINIRFITKEEFVVWLHQNDIRTITNYFRYFAENGEFTKLPLNPTFVYGVTLDELGLVDDSANSKIQPTKEQYRTLFFNRETFARYLCENDIQLCYQYRNHYATAYAQPFLPVAGHVSTFMGADWHIIRDGSYFSLDEFIRWFKFYGRAEMGCHLTQGEYHNCRKRSPYQGYLPTNPAKFYCIVWGTIARYDIDTFRGWLKANNVTRQCDYINRLKEMNKSERCFLYYHPTVAYDLPWKCIVDSERPLPFTRDEFLTWAKRNRVKSLVEYQRIRPKFDDKLAAQCPYNPLNRYDLTEDEAFG